MFVHAALERGMWRGWFRNGQSIEITWPRTSVGLALRCHSDDDDTARLLLWIGLGVIQAYIPVGRAARSYAVGDEPSWGIDLSCEFGIVWRWRQVYRQWNWPFHRINLDWSYETAEGWRSVMGDGFDRYREESEIPGRPGAVFEKHPYTYVLHSGEVQHRTATIYLERWIRGRHILSRLFGWPRRTEYTIGVNFDGEVGEESGSWKGGCIGCSYDMRPGEAPVDALRRMERERSF